MTKVSPCPECGETPKPERSYTHHDYFIVCECHDPTPMHSYEGLQSPKYQGTGKTEQDAINDWNERIEEDL